jgi:hypothetical protein
MATSSAAADRGPKPRGSGANLAAFIVGPPLAAVILCLVLIGPLSHTVAHRYLSHPVECVEVVLFCCALGALGAKAVRSLLERRACRTEVLPTWSGKAVPVAEATALLGTINRLPTRMHDTCLVNRVVAVLDFLCRRGSAAELDDHMRTLTDNDALALESSYSLVRFITWAIPILGFLGTVLGITGAISGVTPEVLEQSLSTVTDGLALAFDATALALGLTMLLMFVTFLVDRAEQGVLESVDRYVDRQLAHRFERPGADTTPFVEVVKQQSQVVLNTMEQLVERQTQLWSQAFHDADERRNAAETTQEEMLTAALEKALERTLETHSLRMAAFEKQAITHSSQLAAELGKLATAVCEQQTSLAMLNAAVTEQARAIAGVQEGERHLLQLQEVLNKNLTALAGAGAFEEALHSLTAAVHMLTARTAVLPNGNPSRLSVRSRDAA